MTRTQQSPAQRTTAANRAIYQNRHPYFTPTIKQLPPFARAIAWKRTDTNSNLLLILTGDEAKAEALSRVETEGRYSDPPSLFAVLPFHRNPSEFDWSFATGMEVGIKSLGKPETDAAKLALARMLLEAGAVCVVVTLAAGLEIFHMEDGVLWRK